MASPPAGVRLRELPKVGKAKQPHRWNEEVVRALSTRLPYGRTALTARCDVCHSAFFPCPCENTKKPHEQVHAPRIVEETERHRQSQRQNGTGMGSLALVKQHTFNHGMDRTRLLVQGVETETKSYSIISRQGCRYVVSLDGEKAWQQDVPFSPEELRALIRNMKYGPAGPKRKYLSPHEVVETELTIRGGQELLASRRVAVEYAVEEVALSDLSLLPVPRAAAPQAPAAVGQQDPLGELSAARDFLFFVRFVRPGGSAETAGVRPGHLLVRVKRENSSRNVDYLEPCADLLEPFVKSEGGEAISKEAAIAAKYSKPRARRLIFPCSLEFSLLPEGWTADSVVRSTGDSQQLQSLSELEGICNELVNPGQRLTISFVRQPIAVITRSDEQRVRHEHIWEREVFNRTTHDVTREDLAMLVEWGVKSRLTPSQLEYTCKKLINGLSNELQAFEQRRKQREQQLVQKAQRCVKIQLDDYRDEKERARALEVGRHELRSMLKQCPMYFLYEVRDGCNHGQDTLAASSPNGSVPGTPKSPSPRPPRARMGHHGGEGGSVHVDHSEKTRERLVSHIDSRVTSVVSLVGRARGTFGAGSDKSDERKTFDSKVLAEVVAAVEEELHLTEFGVQAAVEPEPGVPGRIKIQWNASGTHYQRDDPGRHDGRLSFEEFTKVLHQAGISWLTREELTSNFNTMDMDKSGFLSLGEVLRVSERMVQRMRQLRDFEARLEERAMRAGGANRKLSFAELIEAFVRQTCPELLDNVDSTRKFTLDGERTKHPGDIKAVASGKAESDDRTQLPGDIKIAVNGKAVDSTGPLRPSSANSSTASLKPPTRSSLQLRRGTL